jgi:hypothetical protein
MRWLLIIGALAALMTGCGSSSNSGSLDPQVEDAYVEAQAQALCLMQTTAYPTQAEQQAAYKKAQQRSKLTADEYAEAEAAAANDEALRKRVSARATELCG